MRLRTIRAARMSDAMATLRAELGEDAVILSTRRVGAEVELTAAAEPEDEPLLIAPDPPRPPATPPALKRHNIPATLAMRLTVRPLAAALEAAFAFAPLPAGPTPLLLAGPPGAGKTLAAAKLATRLVMAGGAPLLVSADGRRAGATEQLAAFARVLGLPLAVAGTPGALGKALSRRAEGQAAIVDLPGCDAFCAASRDRLAALLAAARGAPVLVLPAGLDAEEAADLARAFHAAGCRHLLPTRLDAARRLGGVLAAAAEGLALTEAGTGPDAAAGLTPITAAWLAARLEQGFGA